MKDIKVVKMQIARQGAPVANHAIIIAESENIVAIGVDFKSKYCEIGFATNDVSGIPGIYAIAGERTIHLKGGIDRDEPTEIQFPKYKGWRVFAAGFSRYTLNICLIKREE